MFGNGFWEQPHEIRSAFKPVTKEVYRRRQAACHSGLVPGQEADGSSKVSLLVERIEQAVEDGHKALVFSQWTSLLDRPRLTVGGGGDSGW